MKPFLKNNILFFLLLTAGGLAFLNSCDSKGSKETEEVNTHSEGTLKILADDTFKPILWTSVETFGSIYPKAIIQLEYQAQEPSFIELLKGNVDLIVAGRNLTSDEERVIRSRGRIPKVNKIASDGIVFIVSENNADTLVSESKLSEILSGKLKFTLVCDKSNSGNLLYLKERFKLKNGIFNLTAAGSDSAVIEYVSAHSEAIGIIGMTLVSDLESPKVKKRLKKVNLLSVEYKDSLGKSTIGHPTLEELATEKYPFIRDIFIINLDGNMNLGTGFANYMVSERGQRIILKAGILPATLPGREMLLTQ